MDFSQVRDIYIGREPVNEIVKSGTCLWTRPFTYPTAFLSLNSRFTSQEYKVKTNIRTFPAYLSDVYGTARFFECRREVTTSSDGTYNRYFTTNGIQIPSNEDEIDDSESDEDDEVIEDEDDTQTL